MKNKNFLFTVIFPSIFMGIGILLVVFAVLLHISNSKFMETAIETTAEITNIHVSYDSDDDAHYTVDIKFNANGKEYSGILNSYDSSMYKGENITIYYNPDNPNNFKYNTSFVYVILLIMGAVFFGAGLIVFYWQLKSRPKKFLKETGRKLDAKIDSIALNTNFTINGKNPYIINCSYFNEIEDKLYSFTSENIWTNIEPIIESKGITTIPVYLDESNSSNYYVDISIFEKYIGN